MSLVRMATSGWPVPSAALGQGRLKPRNARLGRPEEFRTRRPRFDATVVKTGAARDRSRMNRHQYCPEDGFRDSANAMQGKELNAILVFVDLKSEESKTALAEGK